MCISKVVVKLVLLALVIYILPLADGGDSYKGSVGLSLTRLTLS